MNKEQRHAQLEVMEAKAQEVGRLIGGAMPEGCGFFLMMYQYGEGGWSTFVSNGRRDDTVKMIEEMLPRLKSDDYKKVYPFDEEKHAN